MTDHILNGIVNGMVGGGLVIAAYGVYVMVRSGVQWLRTPREEPEPEPAQKYGRYPEPKARVDDDPPF